MKNENLLYALSITKNVTNVAIKNLRNVDEFIYQEIIPNFYLISWNIKG